MSVIPLGQSHSGDAVAAAIRHTSPTCHRACFQLSLLGALGRPILVRRKRVLRLQTTSSRSAWRSPAMPCWYGRRSTIRHAPLFGMAGNTQHEMWPCPAGDAACATRGAATRSLSDTAVISNSACNMHCGCDTWPSTRIHGQPHATRGCFHHAAAFPSRGAPAIAAIRSSLLLQFGTPCDCSCPPRPALGRRNCPFLRSMR